VQNEDWINDGIMENAVHKIIIINKSDERSGSEEVISSANGSNI
jgi:hypothetical protein